MPARVCPVLVQVSAVVRVEEVLLVVYFLERFQVRQLFEQLLHGDTIVATLFEEAVHSPSVATHYSWIQSEEDAANVLRAAHPTDRGLCEFAVQRPHASVHFFEVTRDYRVSCDRLYVSHPIVNNDVYLLFLFMQYESLLESCMGM